MFKCYHPPGIGMTPSTTALGKFIRSRRLKLGIKQVPLGLRCGLARSTVSQIEVGLRKRIKSETVVKKLAQALRCRIEELQNRMPKKRVRQPSTELGKLIRSLREKRGMSINHFAKKMRISLERAEHLELHTSSYLRYELLQPLSRTLGIDRTQLAPFAGFTRKETPSPFGNLVRSRRKELGINLKALAKKLNVSRQYVNQIELGQATLSTNDRTLKRLARALRLHKDEVVALRPLRKLKKRLDATSTLGGFLAKRRLQQNLTQIELAARTGIDHCAISNMETGTRIASGYYLDKLSKALNCTIPPELVSQPPIKLTS